MYQLIEKVVGNNRNFQYFPVTSQPVNHSIFRNEAFIKISIEAPPVLPYRDLQLNIVQCIPYIYRQLHR